MVTPFVANQTENDDQYNINRELKPLPFLVNESFYVFVALHSFFYSPVFCSVPSPSVSDPQNETC